MSVSTPQLPFVFNRLSFAGGKIPEGMAVAAGWIRQGALRSPSLFQ